MRFKALAGLCRREGCYFLYDRINEDGEVIGQWLGVAGAVFPIHGLPRLNEENMIPLFDITTKQLETVIIKHSELPEGLNFEDTDTAEVLLDREKITLAYGKRIVRPLMTQDGLEFINNDFLTPLADVADDLELYERRRADGGAYFAAKMGLMVVGIIMPLAIIEEELVEDMETLAEKARAAYRAKKDREDLKNGLAGQMTIDEGSGTE